MCLCVLFFCYTTHVFLLSHFQIVRFTDPVPAIVFKMRDGQGEVELFLQQADAVNRTRKPCSDFCVPKTP